MSLFSVFDPVSFLGLSINWTLLFFIVLAFPCVYYFFGSFLMEVKEWVMKFLSGMLSEVSFPNFEGLVLMSSVLFFFISMMNIMGLFPFVFSVTGHVVVTFSMGFILWMMSMLMGWMMSFKMSSAHLVPEGSPLVLAPFMVMIESVSHLIRPVTLSVRLAANMMAGHLIVGLISSISLISSGSFLSSIIMQSMMLVLEWGVCFIQAFVFSVLVMLYALDFY